MQGAGRRGCGWRVEDLRWVEGALRCGWWTSCCLPDLIVVLWLVPSEDLFIPENWIATMRDIVPTGCDIVTFRFKHLGLWENQENEAQPPLEHTTLRARQQPRGRGIGNAQQQPEVLVGQTP